ncbi:MAG: hypothetical protein Q9215_002271 [Flavoplaca cf. flavocitrina]
MDTSPETSGRSPPNAPGPYMGLADEVVTILVGPEKTPFRIHKGLLCSKSEYFRAALEGFFKESTEKSVHLRDEDPGIFQFYATWIYSQKLVVGFTQRQLSMDVCCRLYVLADKLGSDDVQNLAIDLIHERCTRSYDDDINSSIVNFVYDNTLPDSRLRAILIDIASYEVLFDYAQDLVGVNPDFIFEVVKVLSRRVPHRLKDEKAPLDMNRCKTYHIHTNGRSCPPTPSESSASEHESKAEEEGL